MITELLQAVTIQTPNAFLSRLLVSEELLDVDPDVVSKAANAFRNRSGVIDVSLSVAVLRFKIALP